MKNKTPPLCIDCEHNKIHPHWQTNCCIRPNGEISLIDGSEILSVLPVRIARTKANCGPDAKHFKQRKKNWLIKLLTKWRKK